MKDVIEPSVSLNLERDFRRLILFLGFIEGTKDFWGKFSLVFVL